MYLLLILALIYVDLFIFFLSTVYQNLCMYSKYIYVNFSFRLSYSFSVYYFADCPLWMQKEMKGWFFLSYTATKHRHKHLTRPAESLLIIVYSLSVCGRVLSCCAALMLCSAFVRINPPALFFWALYFLSATLGLYNYNNTYK